MGGEALGGAGEAGCEGVDAGTLRKHKNIIRFRVSENSGTDNSFYVLAISNIIGYDKLTGMTMRRAKALHLLREHQAEIASYGVRRLAISGSVARDEARSDSDVDILVEFFRPVGLFQFIGLKQYLESLLGCQVDLGTARSLKAHLAKEVMESAIYVA